MKKSAPTNVGSQGKTVDVQLEFPLRARLREELRGVVISLGIQETLAMIADERSERWCPGSGMCQRSSPIHRALRGGCEGHRSREVADGVEAERSPHCKEIVTL